VTTEHTCIGKVWGGYSSNSCGKKAKHEHNGKWYCKTHHPPTVEAKKEARNERWEKQFAEQRERIAQQEAQRVEQKRRAGLYPELLEALRMVRDADDDCHKDGLSTMPPAARATIDAAITKAEEVKP
jgi:hypothetical protein